MRTTDADFVQLMSGQWGIRFQQAFLGDISSFEMNKRNASQIAAFVIEAEFMHISLGHCIGLQMKPASIMKSRLRSEEVLWFPPVWNIRFLLSILLASSTGLRTHRSPHQMTTSGGKTNVKAMHSFVTHSSSRIPINSASSAPLLPVSYYVQSPPPLYLLSAFASDLQSNRHRGFPAEGSQSVGHQTTAMPYAIAQALYGRQLPSYSMFLSRSQDLNNRGSVCYGVPRKALVQVDLRMTRKWSLVKR